MLRVAYKLLQWQPAKASGWVSGRPAGTAAAAAAAGGAPPGSLQGKSDGRYGMTDFVRRASHFKRRMRGKSQYAFGREEAQRFLDAEVPKADLSTWMDTGTNAIALSQLLQFFEIQPEASVASLLLNKLIRQAEDNSLPVFPRINTGLCLLYLRPEENYERVFQMIAQVLQQLQSTPPAAAQHALPPQDDHAANAAFNEKLMALWDPLGACAKILQRCGKRAPPALNDELAQAVTSHLHATPPDVFPRLQHSLLRFYSWMVRAERPEANQVLFVLVEHTGDFTKDQFATLTLACVRHNQLVPLPIELVERLTRTAVHYCNSCNAREAANTLGSLAKLIHSLVPNVNGVTTADLYRVQDYFSALLEDYSSRIIRFMDPGDTLYWAYAEDVCTIVFAYELGGHMRYRRVFEAYGAYVQHCVQTFEPPQLALATGILRRAQLLTPQLASKLSERIEVVLGELRLAELSHICATFAVLPAPNPTWWEEAKAVALRLHVPDASGVVRLNLAIAFPDEPNLVDTVDYAQIASKQLVDVLPITLGSAQFEEPVVSALCGRLAAVNERFTPDDLRLLLSCGRPVLLQAAQEHLRRAFAEPQWNTDTLFSLPLVCDPTHPERNQQTFSPAKALAAAKVASVGPQQFVSLANLLVTTFGDGDAAIRQFVRVGGEDLVRSTKVSTAAVVRYLTVVRRYPSIVLGTEWLRTLTDNFDNAPPLSKADLEDFLISLRTLYEDAAKTPALQTLLSMLVDRSYAPLEDADEQTARITVLLVYLQSGMTLPLLTTQHAVLARVTANDAAYSPEVRKALAMMPLPKFAPAEERRGRFVLKHLDKPRVPRDDTPPSTLDLNTTDPFEIPLDTAAPLAAAAAEPAQTSTPQQQQPSSSSSSLTTPSAATSSAVTPLPDPYRPPPPPPEAEPAATAPTVEAAAAAAPEEKHVSYYAKFFSSSVGQILTGRGKHDDAHRSSKEKTTNDTATSISASADAPQPRRTRLHPSAPGTSAAVTDEGSVVTSTLSPPAAASTPSQRSSAIPTGAPAAAVPVTSFTTGWGTASSTTPSVAGWAFATNPVPFTAVPSSASPASAAAVSGDSGSAEHEHNSAINSLFGSAPPPPVAPLAAVNPVNAAPPSPSTARPAEAGGNNIFFDPSNPSSAAATSMAAPHSRLVISRKAVITRLGAANHSSGNVSPTAASANPRGSHVVATAEQDDIRHIYNDTSRAMELHAGGGAAGGPQIVLNARSMPNTAESDTYAASSSDNGFGHHSGNMGSSNSSNGMAHFMRKTGVTKITGYNMDGEATNAAAEEAAGAPAAGTTTSTSDGNRPSLDWMDAARRVARITRHPRTKTKSRTHSNLSAWLNTPSARLGGAPEETEDAVGAAAAAEAERSGERETKTSIDGPAKTGARQTTVAAALHRKRTRKDVVAAAAEKAAAEEAADAEAEAAAAAEADSATPAQGKRGGHGKGGKAATGGGGGSGKAARAIKLIKAAVAASKKAPTKKAAVTKPAATKAASGGRAKKTAAATPAEKPAVKPAKKAVKAASKKAAPAKKKLASGKGKKK